MTGRGRAGGLLREWRRRRRLSQADVSEVAGVSTRHLSNMETGRAGASRDLWLHLARCLEIPPRATNELLLAAGFAPALGASGWDGAALAPMRRSLVAMVDGLAPLPALVVDRLWNVVAANVAARRLVAGGVAPELLRPPVNVLRLTLHPDGLRRVAPDAGACTAARVRELELRAQRDADPELAALVDELAGYLADAPDQPAAPDDPASAGDRAVALLRVATPVGEVRLYTTVATLAAPLDVATAELAIEMFVPFDDASRSVLHRLADTPSPGEPPALVAG